MKNAATVGLVGSILLFLASLLWFVNGLTQSFDWMLEELILGFIPVIFVYVINLLGHLLLVLFFAIYLSSRSD